MVRVAPSLLTLLALALPVRGQSAAEALQARLDSGRVALGARGASATVILPDGSVWTGVSGEAYDGVAVEPETVFEIGSVTKTFSAALLAKLEADGHLDLDDPVSTWVEDAPSPPGATLTHLLQHTSGLADAADDPAYVPALIASAARSWEPRETFDYLGEPSGEPGSVFHYSSTGYLLAGLAAEAATGQPFPRLMRDRVLEPLGMERTFVGGSETPTPPEAHPFLDIDGDGDAEDLRLLVPSTAFLTAAGAAGALLSTSADIARALRRLHSGDFLPPDAYEAMTSLVERPDGRRYGLGVLVDDRLDVRRLGHEGNSAGFSAAAWHLPDESLTVVVLTNAHLQRVEPIVVSLLEVVRGG